MKHPQDIFRISAAFLFLAVMVLSGCGVSQEVIPTDTPTSQPTQPPTSTPNPTATPDPIVQALEQADQLWQTGDAEGAISQYSAILQQSSDSASRAKVFQALVNIGAQTQRDGLALKKQSSSDETLLKVCELNRLALSAYEPVLMAEDRPAFDQTPFYIDDAYGNVALIDCYTSYFTPRKSIIEVDHILMDNLALFPDNPEIKNIFVPAILNLVLFQIRSRYQENHQEVLDEIELVKTKIGDYPVDNKKVADLIDGYLLDEDLCSGNPPLIEGLKTSSTKKFYSCDTTASGILYQAGMATKDPAEIWYLVDFEKIRFGRCDLLGLPHRCPKVFQISIPRPVAGSLHPEGSLDRKSTGQKNIFQFIPKMRFHQLLFEHIKQHRDLHWRRGKIDL